MISLHCMIDRQCNDFTALSVMIDDFVSMKSDLIILTTINLQWKQK